MKCQTYFSGELHDKAIVGYVSVDIYLLVVHHIEFNS